MSEEKVVSLWGHPTGEREVYDGAVAVVQEALPEVESGEVIGVVIVKLHHDGLCSYQVGGRVGGYSMIGGLHVATDDVMRVVRELD